MSNIAFDTFLKERNFIVHEFFRSLTREKDIEIHHKRLNDFIDLSEVTEKAIKGLLSQLTEAAAHKEGRIDEFELQPEDEVNRKYYEAFAALHMHANGEIELPPIKGIPVPE